MLENTRFKGTHCVRISLLPGAGFSLLDIETSLGTWGGERGVWYSLHFENTLLMWLKLQQDYRGLTLVEDEGCVALCHLVALLSQQEVLDHCSIVVLVLIAVVGSHQSL